MLRSKLAALERAAAAEIPQPRMRMQRQEMFASLGTSQAKVLARAECRKALELGAALGLVNGGPVLLVKISTPAP